MEGALQGGAEAVLQSGPGMLTKHFPPPGTAGAEARCWTVRHSRVLWRLGGTVRECGHGLPSEGGRLDSTPGLEVPRFPLRYLLAPGLP